MSQRAVRPSSAPQRLRTSTAQLREMDSVWEQMSMELSAAVAFAVSHQPEAPLAAIVEQLSHHLPEGSTAALRAENASLHAQVRKFRLEIEQLKRSSSVIHKQEAAASPALQVLRDRTQAILAELQAA